MAQHDELARLFYNDVKEGLHVEFATFHVMGLPEIEEGGSFDGNGIVRGFSGRDNNGLWENALVELSEDSNHEKYGEFKAGSVVQIPFEDLRRYREYPELDELVYLVVDNTARQINQFVMLVQSKCPYKAQFVLEEAIKLLQARV